MEREVGGGIGMGKTCKLKAVSFQCMTKFTTNKKKRLMDKEDVSGVCVCEHVCVHIYINTHIYSGILFSHGKGGNPAICNKVNRSMLSDIRQTEHRL